MLLYIDLVDHEGNVHNDAECSIDKIATVEQLKKQIQSSLPIEPTFQRIFFANARLRGGTLEDAGLNDKDTIIVKHAQLPNWIAMLACVKEARQAKSVDNMGRIVSSVDDALSHLKPLTATNFFTAYPNFRLIQLAFKNDFAHYLDSDDKHIKFALQEYFSKFLGDNAEYPTVIVNCEEKQRGGIQGGLIANVLKDGHSYGRYHVKVHIGLAVYPYNQNADLREIFAYKLLELINIGPTVHFIPNVHYSALGLYIATEEVIGFRQADEVDLTDDQMLERELIRRILVLKDLHSANYGLNSKNELSIIDFKVGDNYGKAGKYWAGENTMDRRRVARACFESWKLESMIPQANSSIFHQKELFRKNGIQYKPSRDFELYLAEIRKNIIYISSSL